jgi:hypothetical protein
MLDKQKTFDTVLAHLRRQGRPALNKEGCRYRTSDGLMCAVGCLIPDARYSPDIENTSGYQVWPLVPEAHEGDGYFLASMQSEMHDGPSADPDFLAAVEHGARTVADTFSLTYSAPSNV